MDKSGAKFKFVGHSTEIIRQSKNKGTLATTCCLILLSCRYVVIMLSVVSHALCPSPH